MNLHSIYPKLSLSILALGFGLCTLGIAGPATAQVTLFTDRTSFDAASPGLPIETFENSQVPSGGVAGIDGPLDKNSNNAAFQPGDILDGLRLDSNPAHGAGGLGLAVTNNFVGTTSNKVFANFFVDTLDLTFYNNDVTAVGFDVSSLFAGGNVDITIFGANGQIGASTVVAPNTGVGAFFGVLSGPSTGVITRINLSSQTFQAEGVDNVAFGAAAVPEPGSLGLLAGVGVTGMAFAFSRVRRRRS